MEPQISLAQVKEEKAYMQWRVLDPLGGGGKL